MWLAPLEPGMGWLVLLKPGSVLLERLGPELLGRLGPGQLEQPGLELLARRRRRLDVVLRAIFRHTRSRLFLRRDLPTE